MGNPSGLIETENDAIREFQNGIKELILDADRLRPLVNSCKDAIER